MIRTASLQSARWLTAAMLVALLPSCTAPSSYMGIDISPAATSPLAALARRAALGDKLAQLDLGIAFEEGRGTARDLRMARSLYARAASDSGGPVWVYQPPVGGGSGRVVSIDRGPRIAGLPDARRRLAALDNKIGRK